MRYSSYPEAWALAIIGVLIMVFGSQLAEAQTHRAWDTHPNYDARTQYMLDSDNDCSVIALAIAADIPYHRSFMLHRDLLGRECASCVQEAKPFWEGIGDVLAELHLAGNILVRPDDEILPNVAQLAIAYPNDFIYVVIDGHALAIVNGIVWNNAADSNIEDTVLAAFVITRLPPCFTQKD